MNINAINSSCSFGKKPIFNCTVKRKGTNEKQSATLYLFDKNNYNDRQEIENSNLPVGLRINFTTPYKSTASKFYCLQTDDTKEFVSVAQITRHLNRNEGKYEGINTIIDEYGENENFVDAVTPVMAQVAQTAQDKGDRFIMTAFRAEEAPSLKRAGFSESKYGNWIMPEKRYVSLIDRAEKRTGIGYLA